ncbi:MAG: hypothetical protein A2X94_01930 [Bdellovibrionales bacterium GWB1_55_8]|nr:MAG: hypothetical protein A2X94_01930 [Bdellovibrionales bacterium GWB1_55_8]
MQRQLRNVPAAWIVLWSIAAASMQLTTLSHELVNRLLPPAGAHLFGFDAFGRDLLMLTLRASFVSILFASFATALSCILALGIGCAVALLPNRIRFPFLRLLEAFLAFPSLLFSLLLAAVLGPGWTTLSAALLIGIAPGMVRLVYVRSRELLAEDYIVAAKSLGAPPLSIIRRHLFPAAASLCAVKTPNLFAQALIAEATLTFLGIGAPYAQDTWGSLLAQGKEYLIEAPHVALGSGLPLVLTALSLQLLTQKLSGYRAQV